MIWGILLLAIVAVAVARISARSGRDDDDDGPGGMRRIPIRVEDRNPRGPR
jgi:hypothetical protein